MLFPPSACWTMGRVTRPSATASTSSRTLVRHFLSFLLFLKEILLIFHFMQKWLRSLAEPIIYSSIGSWLVESPLAAVLVHQVQRNGGKVSISPDYICAFRTFLCKNNPPSSVEAARPHPEETTLNTPPLDKLRAAKERFSELIYNVLSWRSLCNKGQSLKLAHRHCCFTHLRTWTSCVDLYFSADFGPTWVKEACLESR